MQKIKDVEWANSWFTLGFWTTFIVANIPEHKSVGSFTAPANHNIEEAGDGAYSL